VARRLFSQEYEEGQSEDACTETAQGLDRDGCSLPAAPCALHDTASDSNDSTHESRGRLVGRSEQVAGADEAMLFYLAPTHSLCSAVKTHLLLTHQLSFF
jgi:hypothetical protein